MAAAKLVPSWSRLTVVVVVVVIAVNLRVLSGERVLGETNDDFDFDGLPGAQHEFKVSVPAGVEDCFFQKVAQKATLHVSFEVLRGGDRSVNVMVRNSQDQIVNAHQFKSEGVIEFESPYEEIYAVCVDNLVGGFSSKLVYLYIVAFAMDDWSAYVKEIDDLHGFAENATRSLTNVEQSVQTMWKSQSKVRFNAVRDMYLVVANHRYVQNWSILQCVVIIATSIVQVVFVRRLFRTPNVTPSAKPRA